MAAQDKHHAWSDADTDTEEETVLDRNRLSLFTLADYDLAQETVGIDRNQTSTVFDSTMSPAFPAYERSGTPMTEVEEDEHALPFHIRSPVQALVNLVIKYHWLGDTDIVSHLFTIPHTVDEDDRDMLLADRRKMANILDSVHNPVAPLQLPEGSDILSSMSELGRLTNTLTQILIRFHWLGDLGVMRAMFNSMGMQRWNAPPALMEDRRRMVNLLLACHPLLKSTDCLQHSDKAIPVIKTTSSEDEQFFTARETIEQQQPASDVYEAEFSRTLNNDESSHIPDNPQQFESTESREDTKTAPAILDDIFESFLQSPKKQTLEPLEDFIDAFFNVNSTVHPQLEANADWKETRGLDEDSLVEVSGDQLGVTAGNSWIAGAVSTAVQHISGIYENEYRQIAVEEAAAAQKVIDEHLQLSYSYEEEFVRMLTNEDKRASTRSVETPPGSRWVTGAVNTALQHISSIYEAEFRKIAAEEAAAAQKVIDEHLALSYVYEAQFRKLLAAGETNAVRVTDIHRTTREQWIGGAVNNALLHISSVYEEAFRRIAAEEAAAAQKVIDEHLALSYAYEAEFRRRENRATRPASISSREQWISGAVSNALVHISSIYEEAFRRIAAEEAAAAQKVIDEHLALSYAYEAEFRRRESGATKPFSITTREEWIGGAVNNALVHISSIYEEAFRKIAADEAAAAQRVIDEHLQLSYVYEQEFKKLLATGETTATKSGVTAPRDRWIGAAVNNALLHISSVYEEAFRKIAADEAAAAQRVIDEHLHLSYICEAEFVRRLSENGNAEQPKQQRALHSSNAAIPRDQWIAASTASAVNHISSVYEAEFRRLAIEESAAAQAVIDEHFRLSYVYEAEFVKTIRDGELSVRPRATPTEFAREVHLNPVVQGADEGIAISLDSAKTAIAEELGRFDREIQHEGQQIHELSVVIEKLEGVVHSVANSASSNASEEELEQLQHLVARIETVADVPTSQIIPQKAVESVPYQTPPSSPERPVESNSVRSSDGDGDEAQKTVDRHLTLSFQYEAAWWKAFAEASATSEVDNESSILEVEHKETAVDMLLHRRERDHTLEYTTKVSDAHSLWEHIASRVRNDAEYDEAGESEEEDIEAVTTLWLQELTRLKSLLTALRSATPEEAPAVLNLYLSDISSADNMSSAEGSVMVIRKEMKRAIEERIAGGGGFGAEWVEGLVKVWEEELWELVGGEETDDVEEEDVEEEEDTEIVEPLERDIGGQKDHVVLNQGTPKDANEVDILRARVAELESALTNTQSQLSQLTVDHQLVLSYNSDLADVASTLPNQKTLASQPSQVESFVHHLSQVLAETPGLVSKLSASEARLAARDSYLRTSVIDSARQVQHLEQQLSDLRSRNEELERELRLEQRGKRSLQRELVELDEIVRRQGECSECGAGVRGDGKRMMSVKSGSDNGSMRGGSERGGPLSRVEEEDTLGNLQATLEETQTTVENLRGENWGLRFALEQMKTDTASIIARLEVLEREKEKREWEALTFVHGQIKNPVHQLQQRDLGASKSNKSGNLIPSSLSTTPSSPRNRYINPSMLHRSPSSAPLLSTLPSRASTPQPPSPLSSVEHHQLGNEAAQVDLDVDGGSDRGEELGPRGRNPFSSSPDLSLDGLLSDDEEAELGLRTNGDSGASFDLGIGESI